MTARAGSANQGYCTAEAQARSCWFSFLFQPGPKGSARGNWSGDPFGYLVAAPGYLGGDSEATSVGGSYGALGASPDLEFAAPDVPLERRHQFLVLVRSPGFGGIRWYAVLGAVCGCVQSVSVLLQQLPTTALGSVFALTTVVGCTACFSAASILVLRHAFEPVRGVFNAHQALLTVSAVPSISLLECQ